jgi:UDP-N-acetylmuramoylalanine--D-glutamate ligase
MRVAIVGYGVEGKSAAKYWRVRGADITICDQNATLETEGFRAQLGDGYLQGLDRFNLIVRTAGMNPDIILSVNPNVGPKMTTLMMGQR